MLRSRPLPGFRPVLVAAVALLLSAATARPASAQPDADGFRVGVTLGGISFVGLTMEYRLSSRSVDVTVGTWALRDVSVSVVGKQYLGPGRLRPYFGIGLWGVAAFPDDGIGSVLVVRAPVGVDWQVVERNYLGAAMNITRGIWVDRADPEDDTPLNRRLVPLPGFYYRWRP